ncbi:hypothetical protein [Sphingomonas sp.]|jgi:hypothetical protein|uniref:hypothetical protein n=1 Tax=Sphingomonas sp. TaxID=28214 RepID=UPI002ED818A4
MLGSAYGLAVVDCAETLGFLEPDRRPFLARVAGVIDRARSRTQLEIMLHLKLR